MLLKQISSYRARKAFPVVVQAGADQNFFFSC